jgi:hypothetical protein
MDSYGPEFVFALANIGLLTGIFFRLGGLTKTNENFGRRLEKLERKIHV